MIPRSRFTGEEVAAMMRMPKQARVRNVAPRADRTYDGRVYHSKAEALYAFELDAQMSACMIFKWRPQVTLPCIVNGALVCKVILDFEIQDRAIDPAKRYVEIKGWASEAWKLKKKLLLACYPNLKLEVIRA